jgi:penicillin-binding protein 2
VDDYYTEESLGNQMRTLPITPARGKIFDRYGRIIATNQPAYKLTLTLTRNMHIGAIVRIDSMEIRLDINPNKLITH